MLEGYLENARGIIYDRFGVVSQGSRLVIHKDWNKFIEHQGLRANADGFFSPMDLTAHIPYLDSKNMIPLSIHELLGHGTFCEYSSRGTNLREKEKIYLSLPENNEGGEGIP